MKFIYYFFYIEVKYNEEFGLGYDEYDFGLVSLYYVDEVFGFGFGNWDDDNDEGQCRILVVLYGFCIYQNLSFLKKMFYIINGCRMNRNVEQRWFLVIVWEQFKLMIELYIFLKIEGVVVKMYFFFEIVLFVDDELEYRKFGIF